MRWNRAARVSLDLQKPISESQVPSSVSWLLFLTLRPVWNEKGGTGRKTIEERKINRPHPDEIFTHLGTFRSLPHFLKCTVEFIPECLGKLKFTLTKKERRGELERQRWRRIKTEKKTKRHIGMSTMETHAFVQLPTYWMKHIRAVNNTCESNSVTHSRAHNKNLKSTM